VAVAGQQADPPPKRDGAGQLEVNLPADDLGALDGQGGRDVATAGVHSDEPSSPDPGDQGADVEHHRQAELDSGHAVIVDQQIDRGVLGRGDLVRGQVDELEAARRGHGALGSGDDLTMFLPPRHQQTDQIDIKQTLGRVGGLADSCLAERGRDVLQSVTQVFGGAGQHRPEAVLTRGGQQIQNGLRGVLRGRRHGLASLIVVMLAPGLDSMRTVCVTPAPVFWTLTRAGGPGTGAARTLG